MGGEQVAGGAELGVVHSGHAKRVCPGLPQEAQGDWWRVGRALRQRLVGRAFTRGLLNEVERIAMRHADPAHRRRLAGLH